MCHRDVVRLGGQLVDQFLVPHHGDEPRSGIAKGQRPVIETGAASEPDTVAIDSEAAWGTSVHLYLPRSAEALQNSALLRLRLGDLAAARELNRRALEIDPTNPAALHLRARLASPAGQ